MTELAVESVAPERIDVGDGISIAAAWEAIVTDEPGIDGVLRIRAVYDRTLRRAVAASVTVDRRGDGDEVTALTLREVRVQAAVATSAMRVVQVCRDGEEPRWLSSYRADIKDAKRTSAEAITEAVVLYRIAFTINWPPLRFVASELDVSVSTATRMMAKARQRGLATDLITRETYNRMQNEQQRISAPYQPPGSGPGGPSIGR